MTLPVNGTSYHRLACAAFAQDQNGGGSLRGTQQYIHDIAHRTGAKIEEGLGVLRGGLLHLLFQPLNILVQLLEALDASERHLKLFPPERFFQEVHRTAPHRFDRVFESAMGRENDDREIGLLGQNLTKNVQAALPTEQKV